MALWLKRKQQFEWFSSSGQDGFLPPPFENEERGTKDQAEKEGGCDKVDKPEKAPKKMLSRGEKFFKTNGKLHIKFMW